MTPAEPGGDFNRTLTGRYPHPIRADDGADTRYEVKIIMREGGWEVGPDWHATVTRKSDGSELVFTGGWLWLLRRRVRRAALDRAFRRYDRHQAKLAKVRSFDA